LYKTTLMAVDYFLWIYKLLSRTTKFVMLHTQRHGSAEFTVLNLEKNLRKAKILQI